MRCIDHVQQHVRLSRLLERRAERRHQVVGQLADEADRVGEAKPVATDVHFAGEGVLERVLDLACE